MKLIVLAVVSVAVFTANCRIVEDGSEDQDFTIEPEALPGGPEDDSSDQDHHSKFGGRYKVADEEDIDSDEQLRAMSVNISSASSNLYTEMNSNKIINLLITNLTLTNAKMFDFMTSSIKKLTIANAEMKNELQFIKENMTKALINQDTKLDTVKMNQGCPEGLFYYAPSAQCFLLQNDTTRTWDQANTACQAKGLVLAHPYDPEGIRNYIVTRYGDMSGYIWIGAKGTGSCMKFQDSNRCIGSSNPLWYSRTTSTSHCLTLMAHASQWKSYGIRVYNYGSCSSTRYWSLCELLSE